MLTGSLLAFRTLFNGLIILAGIANWQPFPSPEFPWTYAAVLAFVDLVADIATILDDQPERSDEFRHWYGLFTAAVYYVVLTWIGRAVVSFTDFDYGDPDSGRPPFVPLMLGWLVWFVALGTIYYRFWVSREGVIRLVMFIPWSIRYRRMKRRGETY